MQAARPTYSSSLTKPVTTYSLQPEEIDYYAYECDKRFYSRGALNEKQNLIYNQVVKNPQDIVLIQAGPGTGKTFTLLTIAYNGNIPVNTIIYKHDLLQPFRNCARIYTVASFFMRTFSIRGLPEFIKFERQLCKSSLNAVGFVAAVTSLLKTANLPPVGNSIVFVDEYTVMPKIFLVVLLILFKHHGIGAVICGDKNQLQNIRNSRHAGSLSSYNIAERFADTRYTLSNNERCEDTRYNAFVQYLAQFSCKRQLDHFAYALVTAMFFKQLLSDSRYEHTHLAMHHRELTRTAHLFVLKSGYGEQRKIPVSFYHSVVLSKGLRQLSAVAAYVKRVKTNPTEPGKFLPYLPLVVGAPYYIKKMSENSIGILESIELKQLRLTLRMNTTGELVAVEPGTKFSNVIYDEHRQFLMARDNNVLSDEEDNTIPSEPCRLLNYPIYPANFITFYRSQGCTFTDQLDMNLMNANYQAMYVGLSRVRRPEQIVRVTVRDQLSHLVSCIINFPELVENCASDSLSVKLICDRFSQGRYQHYTVSGGSNLRDELANKVGAFFIDTMFPAERHSIRQQILQLGEQTLNKITLTAPPPIGHNDKERQRVALSFVLNNRELLIKLATNIESALDRNLWLNLYCNMEPTLKSTLTSHCCKDLVLNRICELDKMPTPLRTADELRAYLETTKVLVRVDKHDVEATKKIIIWENELFGYMLTSDLTSDLYALLPEMPSRHWLLSWLEK